ncbi:ABC transporter substrate-binding protein [Paenibacillus hunanensis]|uniref:ABC transporter substrate-binding protein n=1 Tax=Paenibacillus hunanensis TaxID=539262 RepID=UPI002026B627|nr:ABC transporter substrate-binding protein [Paenibacillus hunanensis]MCL9661044.1 ABC transporter substrate-binding protein [Paenibacillus hunanensis]
MNKRKWKVVTALTSIMLIAALLAACGNSGSGQSSGSEGGSTSLSLLVDNSQDSVNVANALKDAYEAKHPDVTIEVETRPGGSEGDNLVKTRLATGDMTDVLFYNSGSLMTALSPEANLEDLTNEAFQSNVLDDFKNTVKMNGKVYGAPIGSTIGGGWFYNKKIYADLGLSVPKTWDELIANSKKIKEAGITPVIGTMKDSWTAQVIILADEYNVVQSAPDFPKQFTAHQATFAGTPSALRSFEKLQSVFDGGFYNTDFLAATYDNGIKMLGEGKGAQYPMLSFALPILKQNYPDQMDNIGYFAQPGDSADKNGLTVWMPSAAYVYKNGNHVDEAKKFVDFIVSADGIAAMAKVSTPTGPYPLKDAKLPDNVPDAVKDMLPYFDSDKTAPALEFVSPIKGPALPQISVEVGAGIKKATEGAAAYDQDVEKQAKQLGLEGW